MSGLKRIDDEARVNAREAEWAAALQAADNGAGAAYESGLRDMASALRPLMRAAALRAGMGLADAEDIVQEVLIAVHLKRHTWDRNRPVGPWLRAIAHYKLIDALRRRGRRVHVPIDDFHETLAAEETGPQVSESEVERSLASLAPRQRDVVRTIAVEGASISETAAKFAMTEGAVRVALHRGLATLRHKYGSPG